MPIRATVYVLCLHFIVGKWSTGCAAANMNWQRKSLLVIACERRPTPVDVVCVLMMMAKRTLIYVRDFFLSLLHRPTRLDVDSKIHISIFHEINAKECGTSEYCVLKLLKTFNTFVVRKTRRSTYQFSFFSTKFSRCKTHYSTILMNAPTHHRHHQHGCMGDNEEEHPNNIIYVEDIDTRTNSQTTTTATTNNNLFRFEQCQAQQVFASTEWEWHWLHLEANRHRQRWKKQWRK